MKATELRIGNFVSRSTGTVGGKPSFFEGIYIVDIIYSHMVSVHDFPKYKSSWDLPYTELGAIPLTERWLNENSETYVGNGSGRDSWYLYSSSEEVELMIIKKAGKFFLADFEDTIISTEIATVHHLQNLFHAYTLEELPVKQPA